MARRRGRRFPSASFVGALLGVACALLVAPPMMLTAAGTIFWLLIWSGAGLAAGAVVESVASRLGGEADDSSRVAAAPARRGAAGRSAELGCSAEGATVQTRHPFLRRVAWNPVVVALLFAYVGYSAYMRGFPVGRTAGAAFVGLWFGLSAFDAASGHRLLDWLYSDEGEATESG